MLILIAFSHALPPSCFTRQKHLETGAFKLTAEWLTIVLKCFISSHQATQTFRFNLKLCLAQRSCMWSMGSTDTIGNNFFIVVRLQTLQTCILLGEHLKQRAEKPHCHLGNIIISPTPLLIKKRSSFPLNKYMFSHSCLCVNKLLTTIN